MQIIDPIYKREYHSLTDQTYHFPNGSYIEFFSADDSGKVRGPGRDILFCNEVNLFPKDTFEQLNLRTRKTVFMDYNPADEFHWLYDRILPLPDCEFIQSTYLDNPFLPIEQIRQIESLKDADPDLWRVYGLGERGATSNVIFPKWQTYTGDIHGDSCYGLDFGFNHPNALCKVTYNDGKLYFEEKFYASHVTTPELIEAIKPLVDNDYVYCDSARPDIIQELRNAGINAREADKDVKGGINWMKSNTIFVHQTSANMQKELRTYKWKTKTNGEILDQPIKLYDDLIDAARYASISYHQQSVPYIMFH
jgi:phage terminase large subunit